MKKTVFTAVLLWMISISFLVFSQQTPSVSSPDGKLKLVVSIEEGKPFYAVSYGENVMLENSPLGLVTNEGDFSTNMTFVKSSSSEVNHTYTQDKIKTSYVVYKANTNDDKNKQPTINQTKIADNGEFTVVIQPKGGFVITDH